jgi:hypothetical protein
MRPLIGSDNESSTLKPVDFKFIFRGSIQNAGESQTAQQSKGFKQSGSHANAKISLHPQNQQLQSRKQQPKIKNWSRRVIKRRVISGKVRNSSRKVNSRGVSNRKTKSSSRRVNRRIVRTSTRRVISHRAGSSTPRVNRDQRQTCALRGLVGLG